MAMSDRAAGRDEESGRKVFVIGLDGATWDIILPLAQKGELPCFKRLLDGGSHGILNSTLPCVTPPAWGTFLTGASPARHTVLDFTKRIDSDIFEFVTFQDLAVPKLWHALTHFDKRSVFLGVPFTFPPERMKGIIVPGPPVPLRGIETWPPDVAAQILDRIPDYTAEPRYGAKEEILGALYRATRNRCKLARWLMKREKWDFFMVTIIATDRLHHKMWHSEDVLAEYYRHLDEELGRLLEGVDDDTYLLLMSDHGFTSVKTKFFPNQWLANQGYLKARFIRPGKVWNPRYMNPTARRRRSKGKVYGWRRFLRMVPGCGDLRWAIDLSETKAFSSFGHFTGVFVNLKGRYEQGIVEPGAAYEKVRDDLIGDLRALREPKSGAPLFKQVARREELFDGPAVERMPDVITEVSDHAFRLRSNLGLDRVFVPFRKKKSYHAPEGILYVKGPGIRKAQRLDDANIQDVAPLILHLMGLPKISTMDGRLPHGALDETFFEGREFPPIDVEEIECTTASHAFSDEDREAITRDMEALGYL